MINMIFFFIFQEIEQHNVKLLELECNYILHL